MKEVKIPQGFNPFKIKVNNVTYEYKPGEIVEVPDEVAEVIENYNGYQNEDPAKKEWVEGFAFDPVADAGKAVMVDENGKLSVGEEAGGGGKESGGAGTIATVTVKAGASTGGGTKGVGSFAYYCRKEDLDKWYGPGGRTSSADYVILPNHNVEMIETILSANQQTVFVVPGPIPSNSDVKLIFVPASNVQVVESDNVSGPVMADFGSIYDGYIISGDFTVTISTRVN